MKLSFLMLSSFHERTGYIKACCEPLEDLIISKIYWAKDSFSEMQIKDIVSLLDLDVDMVYIQDWSARLGLDMILRRVLDERHK